MYCSLHILMAPTVTKQAQILLMHKIFSVPLGHSFRHVVHRFIWFYFRLDSPGKNTKQHFAPFEHQVSHASKAHLGRLAQWQSGNPWGVFLEGSRPQGLPATTGNHVESSYFWVHVLGIKKHMTYVKTRWHLMTENCANAITWCFFFSSRSHEIQTLWFLAGSAKPKWNLFGYVGSIWEHIGSSDSKVRNVTCVFVKYMKEEVPD